MGDPRERPGKQGRGGDRQPRLAARLYALLLHLYPRHLRREDGEDMEEMFADIYQYEPESRGAFGRARLARHTMRDVVSGAVNARLPFLDMLRQDLGYGLRRLRINPTLTLAAVLTLAIGIGAVSSIYSFVDAMVLSPLPYPDVDRVVAIGEVTPRLGLNGEGWIHGAELRQVEQLEAIQSVSGMTLFLVTMTGAGDPAEVVGWRATPSFFAVAGVRPLIGRGFTGSAVDADTVVLGYSFWQRHFGGDPGVLGRTLQLGDRAMTVIGVMPRGAEWPTGTDLWVPLELTPERAASYGPGGGSRPSIGVRAIARLADGASLDQLRAELAPIAAAAAEAAPDNHENTRLAVEPILVNMTINTRQALGFLMGAAVFLLLLVCGNVANMQLAQAAARREEMAMRQALGAPRGRLVRQLLTESVALAALGAIAGTGLAFWSASGLRAVLGQERWRLYVAGVDNVGINPAVLAFTAALSLGSVILFGLVPALRGARVDLNEVLKQSLGRDRRRGNRLRRALVVLEVALSLLLVVGAGVMASSSGAFAHFDPGVDTDVLTVRLRLPPGYEEPAVRQGFFAQAVAESAAIPGVASAALTDRIPAMQSGRGVPLATTAEDPQDAAPLEAQRYDVGGDYFSTLGIAVLHGRAFEQPDFELKDEGPAVAIVSAALAERLWPGESAIGRRLRTMNDGTWLTVVGIAADVASGWNDPQPAPALYVPMAAPRGRSMSLLLSVREGAPGTVAALRERIRSMDDAVVVFAPQSIAESIDSLAGPVRSMNRLVTGMALVALIVCLSGVYALVAHFTGERRREIGVRLALGARDKQVVRMLVGHGLKTAGIGVVIGLPIAFGLARLVARFMAGTRMEGMLPFDGSVLLALTTGVLLLAALASWLPARRATRVDPAVTLRAE